MRAIDGLKLLSRARLLRRMVARMVHAAEKEQRRAELSSKGDQTAAARKEETKLQQDRIYVLGVKARSMPREEGRRLAANDRSGAGPTECQSKPKKR